MRTPVKTLHLGFATGFSITAADGGTSGIARVLPRLEHLELTFRYEWLLSGPLVHPSFGLNDGYAKRKKGLYKWLVAGLDDSVKVEIVNGHGISI
jgi:hypothetical protein